MSYGSQECPVNIKCALAGQESVTMDPKGSIKDQQDVLLDQEYVPKDQRRVTVRSMYILANQKRYCIVNHTNIYLFTKIVKSQLLTSWNKREGLQSKKTPANIRRIVKILKKNSRKFN
jgi:hypothetical protein